MKIDFEKGDLVRVIRGQHKEKTGIIKKVSDIYYEYYIPSISDYAFEKEDLELIENKEIKEEKIIEKKESKNMFNTNKMFGEIGSIKNKEVAITMDGKIAIKRNDEYITFDIETNNATNQMNLVLDDLENVIMLIPEKDVIVDDVIKKEGTYYHIISKDNTVKAYNYKTGTIDEITKEKNLFGFEFYAKVVNIFNMQNGTGFDPMMMLALGKEGDIKDMLMMKMMMGNDNSGFNPMMMLMMKNDKSDFATMMMMSQMFKK